jgi:hypothetical protein
MGNGDTDRELDASGDNALTGYLLSHPLAASPWGEG